MESGVRASVIGGNYGSDLDLSGDSRHLLKTLVRFFMERSILWIF